MLGSPVLQMVAAVAARWGLQPADTPAASPTATAAAAYVLLYILLLLLLLPVQAEGADGAAAWWCRPHSHWTQGEAELAAGALHIAALRRAVTERLGYTCSAGIGHSKLLAKLGSGLHKPAQQTLVPHAAVPGLLAPLPLTRLRSLGGKYGEEIATTLRVTTVGELAALPLARLETALGSDAGGWLWRLARGEDGEDVRPRTLPKSLSAGKTFRGNHSLTALTAVHGWLCELAQELQV